MLLDLQRARLDDRGRASDRALRDGPVGAERKATSPGRIIENAAGVSPGKPSARITRFQRTMTTSESGCAKHAVPIRSSYGWYAETEARGRRVPIPSRWNNRRDQNAALSRGCERQTPIAVHQESARHLASPTSRRKPAPIRDTCGRRPARLTITYLSAPYGAVLASAVWQFAEAGRLSVVSQ